MIPNIQTLTRANEIISRLDSLQSELVGLFNGGNTQTQAPAKRRGRPPGRKNKTSPTPAAGKAPRNMSPEGRARIAAAAKARWAKYNAAKRKAARA